MKKFTSLLIGCSLALAGIAMAQQPVEQQTPTEKQTTQPAEKQGGQKGRRRAAEAQPGTNAGNAEQAGGKHQGQGGRHQRGASQEQNPNAEATPKAERHGGRGKNASGQSATTTASPGVNQQAQQQRKGGRKGRGANANTAPSATPATAAGTSATPGTGSSASAAPVTAASATAAPSVSPNNQQTGQANATGAGRGGRKRPEPQQVQQIKQQHANFRAQPRPDKVPPVTFNQNYRIQGSDRWQGPQYEVFRSYHPERHDQGWYRSHYNRIELIGGGYYYWNNGYWFPAWGYSPQAEYYAYDAPIYVGHRAEPPDRVIADVQAALQEMGYYRGEVDGLLGPLTREALTAYQADNGLTATAVIDEPTLDTLGMG
jgi:hypothetical protein